MGCEKLDCNQIKITKACAVPGRSLEINQVLKVGDDIDPETARKLILMGRAVEQEGQPSRARAK